MTVHEIKDRFLLDNVNEELTKFDLNLAGLNPPFAAELVREWTKLKEQDLSKYPRGIEAKNAMIGAFMGLHREDGQDFGGQTTEMWFNSKGFRAVDGSLTYNKSWDSLIPVCAKALEICCGQKRPTPNHCSYYDWIECQIGTSLREYNRDATYEFAVDFVFYYNLKN